VKTPIVNIPLHRFAAVLIGALGLAAEALVGVTVLQQPDRALGARVEDVSRWIMLAVGIVILVLVPFLFRRKDWARAAIVWLFIVGAGAVVVSAFDTLINVKRSHMDQVGVALTGVILFAMAATAVLFLINRPLVDEFPENRKAENLPNKAPQSTTTAVTPPAGQEARQP
jgi:predicted RND superfamily exporter protein